MAARGLLYIMASLVLIFLSRHASLAQNEAANPETASQNEASRQARISQNEAAHEKLCLAQNALDTSRKLAERFQDSAVLTEEDFHQLFNDIDTGLRDHGGADLMKDCARDATAQLIVDGNVVNCSDVLVEVS